jgi:hypothetical protein
MNQRIGLSRELALEGAMKRSQNRLHNEVYGGVWVGGGALACSEFIILRVGCSDRLS